MKPSKSKVKTIRKEENPREAEAKETKNKWWLEASLFAAVVTALLFFMGVAYLESYYFQFGVSFETLDIPNYWILTNCFRGIAPAIVPIACFLLLRSFVDWIFGSKDNPANKVLDWIIWRNYGFLPLAILTYAYFHLVIYSGNQGKKNAQALIEDPSSSQCTFEVNGKQFEDYFYLYNNANYFYFFRPQGNDRPEVLIVPGSDLKNFRQGSGTPGNSPKP